MRFEVRFIKETLLSGAELLTLQTFKILTNDKKTPVLLPSAKTILSLYAYDRTNGGSVASAKWLPRTHFFGRSTDPSFKVFPDGPPFFWEPRLLAGRVL
jgi:hypothetical protein